MTRITALTSTTTLDLEEALMEEASKETRASKEEALEEVEARHRNNTVRTIIPKIRAMSAPLGPIRRANAVPT